MEASSLSEPMTLANKGCVIISKEVDVFAVFCFAVFLFLLDKTKSE